MDVINSVALTNRGQQRKKVKFLNEVGKNKTAHKNTLLKFFAKH